jgi:hypothetical protein
MVGSAIVCSCWKGIGERGCWGFSPGILDGLDEI